MDCQLGRRNSDPVDVYRLNWLVVFRLGGNPERWRAFVSTDLQQAHVRRWGSQEDELEQTYHASSAWRRRGTNRDMNPRHDCG